MLAWKGTIWRFQKDSMKILRIHSDVWKAVLNGRTVALKELQKASEESIAAILDEVSLMRSLKVNSEGKMM